MFLNLVIKLEYLEYSPRQIQRAPV